MTNVTNNNTGNKPTHNAFFVQGEGDNTKWTELGVAWSHKDGKGFNVKLNLLPVNFDGEIVVRERKE